MIRSWGKEKGLTGSLALLVISFKQVILNAKYEGNDFNVRYDNLVFGTVDVPEPSTLAIFALGMIGLAARRFKK